MSKTNNYSEAVNALLKLAMTDCGGAQPAALTLLSAYDSFRFALPLAELRTLDSQFLDAAYKVISLCANGLSPESIIVDGSEKFEDLATKWQHLNLNEAEHQR